MVEGVAPYLFMGGSPVDYAVRVGQAGTLYTKHLGTGRVVANVAKAGLSAVSTGANIASFAVDALPWVNLGVSVLNLGVSVYTAYKVHKMAKQVDVIDQKVDRLDSRLVELRGAVSTVDAHVLQLGDFMQSAVAHLDVVLAHQSMTLALLVDGQGRMIESLEALHRDMLDGFSNARDDLLSMEARRERAELETHIRSLLRHYQHCTAALAAGVDPPPADVRRVVELASLTAAWLDTRLGTIPVGAPERLPLIMARGMALRMETDGRLFEGTATAAVDRDRLVFLEMVREDGRKMAANATPWELSRGLTPLLTQYVLLNRAFSQPVELGIEDGRGPVALLTVDSLRWTDGLEAHRPIFDRQGERELVEVRLESLADRAWFTQWRGLAPGANVPESIPVSEISSSIGAPAGWRPRQEDLHLLQDLALPRTRTASVVRYAKELR
jgi:hypothetical protein